MKKSILSFWLLLALPLLADPYLELAQELVPEGSPPIRMAFTELVGRGAGSDKWQSSLDLARTKLEEAFKSLQSVTLIDRTNLKALEEENALRGKSTKITEVDTIATGFIMIVEKKLVMSLSLLNTASQKKNTTTKELDPESLGIDIEKDDPPADAAVRLCDSTMFDIVDNLAKIEVNRNEIRNVEIRNDADKKCPICVCFFPAFCNFDWIFEGGDVVDDHPVFRSQWRHIRQRFHTQSDNCVIDVRLCPGINLIFHKIESVIQ